MQIYLTILIAAFCGFLGGFLGSHPLSAPPPLPPSSPPPSIPRIETPLPVSKSADTIIVQNESLNREVDQLRTELAGLKQQFAVLLEQTQSNNSRPKPEESINSEETLAHEAPSDETLRRQTQQREKEVFAQLEAKAQEEAIDHGWAAPLEHEAKAKLNIEGSTVESFECRTSICQLTARHDGPQEANWFRLQMAGRLGRDLPSVQWRTEGNRTIAYFHR